MGAGIQIRGLSGSALPSLLSNEDASLRRGPPDQSLGQGSYSHLLNSHSKINKSRLKRLSHETGQLCLNRKLMNDQDNERYLHKNLNNYILKVGSMPLFLLFTIFVTLNRQQ
jgi:hypothetical protein